MKTIYTLLLGFFCFFASAQPYSFLLKNTEWTIVNIQMNGTTYYPPVPFSQGGKVAFNFDNNDGFKSTFFNVASGKVTFGANNASFFTLQNIGVTLAQYSGVNEQAVNQFDNMVSAFYLGYQPTDQFNFQYTQTFSARNLLVTNPVGDKIFYSNLVLSNSEASLNKGISIYPNPAQNEFYLKSSKSLSANATIEIFDSSGKLVSTEKISSSKDVDIKRLPNGVYNLKISDLGMKYTSKLIIKK